MAYSFGAWTSGVRTGTSGHPECTPLPQFTTIINVSNNIDTFITLIIPSLAIFVMNIRIIFKISYFFDKRSNMTVTFSRGESGRRNSDPSIVIVSTADQDKNTTCSESHLSPRNHGQMKITKMLLVVSTIFLLLNLPSHAIRVYSYFMGFIDPHHKHSYSLVLWQQFFTIIYNCNFSVNFFLYSLYGKNFRKALCQMFANIRYRLWSVCSRPDGATRMRMHGGSISRHDGGSVTQHSILVTTTVSCTSKTSKV